MTSTLSCPTNTVSFEPQQTQNTAPVIEHRCLYTHDLRRKAKRWQDGVLRFHTFNKRVMVYDIPRNYVGDTHWREDYPIQDGDEIELDRPVLVQVGEQVGSIDQDLTELFEKRHKNDATLSARSVPSTSSPPISPLLGESRTGNPLHSQIRPKSLNAVLGTPRGRIGRATLPVKSPYEVRRNNDIAGRDAEPQAKRQCIEPIAHRIGPAIERRGPSTKTSEKFAEKEGVDESAMPRVSRNVGRSWKSQRSIGNLLSSKLDATPFISLVTNEAIIHPNHKKGVSDGHMNVDSPAAQLDATRQQQAQERTSELQVKPTACNPIASRASGDEIFPEPLNTISVSSDTDIGSIQSNGRTSSTTKLQMVSRKPRRKLMYEDLLPYDTTPANNTSRTSNAHISNAERQVRSSGNLRSAQEDERRRKPREDEKGKRVRGADLSSLTENDHNDVEEPHEITNQKATLCEEVLSKRPKTETSEGSRSSIVEIAEPSVSRTVAMRHNSSDALARMDEILRSRSQCQTPTKTKQRSGFKKSVSDTSGTATMNQAGVSLGNRGSLAGQRSEAKEQSVDPWSKEAWDLFGCGKNGQAVDYATFCAPGGV